MAVIFQMKKNIFINVVCSSWLSVL